MKTCQLTWENFVFLVIFDTCDVRIQLYWECTNSSLPSIALESIWLKLGFNSIILSYALSNITKLSKMGLIEFYIYTYLGLANRNSWLPYLQMSAFNSMDNVQHNLSRLLWGLCIYNTPICFPTEEMPKLLIENNQF